MSPTRNAAFALMAATVQVFFPTCAPRKEDLNRRCHERERCISGRTHSDGFDSDCGGEPRVRGGARRPGGGAGREARGPARVLLHPGPARHRQGGGEREGRRRPDPGVSCRDRKTARDLAGGGVGAARVRRSGQGEEQLSGLRLGRPAGRPLRQDPLVRPGARSGAIRRGQDDRGGHRAVRRRFAIRTHRGLRVLRRALSRALPRARAHGHHPRALGVYRHHRTRTLGDAAALPRDREPRLGAGARAGRDACQREADSRPQHGGRSLGQGGRRARYRGRRRGGGHRPGIPGENAPQPPGPDSPRAAGSPGLEYRVHRPHFQSFMSASEQLLSTAQSFLLTPHELEAGKLDRVFGSLLSHRLDYADLYFQYARSEGWSLEEGIVKSGSFSIDQGVGVRAIAGEKTAFAYSDEISLPALEDAARATRAIASGGGNRHPVAARKASGLALYRPIDPLTSLEDRQKVKLLERLESLCRARDPRVIQVMASLGAEYEVVLVARSDGVLAADVRPLVRLSVQVIAEENGRREQGSAGGGGRSDYSHFTDEVLKEYADRAVDQALINLESRPAPAGTMTVVLGPGWPGVLLHEAIGHGLEGDFNRKGSSAFAGKIGKKVAARGVTVVDDGTIPGRRGSLSIDDEGNPTQRNVLIDDGVLRGYMQDSLNARLMGLPVTGNGRRRAIPLGARSGCPACSRA